MQWISSWPVALMEQGINQLWIACNFCSSCVKWSMYVRGLRRRIMFFPCGRFATATRSGCIWFQNTYVSCFEFSSSIWCIVLVCSLVHRCRAEEAAWRLLFFFKTLKRLEDWFPWKHWEWQIDSVHCTWPFLFQFTAGDCCHYLTCTPDVLDHLYYVCVYL